jgi:hypothetical protein
MPEVTNNPIETLVGHKGFGTENGREVYTVQFKWHDETNNGLKTAKPFLALRVVVDGAWITPWIDAKEVNRVINGLYIDEFLNERNKKNIQSL